MDGGGQPEGVPDLEEREEVEILEDVGRGAFAQDGLVEQPALGRVGEIEPVVGIGPVEAEGKLHDADRRSA